MSYLFIKNYHIINYFQYFVIYCLLHIKERRGPHTLYYELDGGSTLSIDGWYTKIQEKGLTREYFHNFFSLSGEASCLPCILYIAIPTMIKFIISFKSWGHIINHLAYAIQFRWIYSEGKSKMPLPHLQIIGKLLTL